MVNIGPGLVRASYFDIIRFEVLLNKLAELSQLGDLVRLVLVAVGLAVVVYVAVLCPIWSNRLAVSSAVLGYDTWLCCTRGAEGKEIMSWELAKIWGQVKSHAKR